MKHRVVLFGEIMMRLSPPDHQRFTQTDVLEFRFGGGEANVAVSLANYDQDAMFVTRLPDNDLGRAAAASVRRYGVDTDAIVWGGDRIGIYFLEHGASQRPSKVIYDRANSAVSQITPGMVDWDAVFEGADWFHWTGITPAISDSAAETTAEAVKAAKAHGLTVSADLNYRKKLWTPEKAGRIMSGLMEYVDVAIGNEEDADKVFGIKAPGADVEAGQIDREKYEAVARQLESRFGFSKVAITLRESISASDNVWSALLYDGNDSYLSRRYDVHIVDRVGGGDSFAGGMIHALLQEMPAQEALEFAAAASCLKHTIPGDFNLVSVSDVKSLMAGGGSGRVQR